MSEGLAVSSKELLEYRTNELKLFFINLIFDGAELLALATSFSVIGLAIHYLLQDPLIIDIIKWFDVITLFVFLFLQAFRFVKWNWLRAEHFSNSGNDDQKTQFKNQSKGKGRYSINER